MENNSKSNTAGVVATIASVLLCGLPGLFGLCLGTMMAVIGLIPGAEIDFFGSSEPRRVIMAGLAVLCLSVIFVAIPLVVWSVTLRRKSRQAISSNEPIPPAI